MKKDHDNSIRNIRFDLRQISHVSRIITSANTIMFKKIIDKFNIRKIN